MSELMLDDARALNNINPFVTHGPGASNKPYGFAHKVPDKDQITCDSYGCSAPKNAQFEPFEPSPLCSWGIHAQTNGSLDAPTCLPKKNPVSCPMGRALEPTQEFLPDLYTLIPYRGSVPKELASATDGSFTLILSVAIIALVALVFVKR